MHVYLELQVNMLHTMDDFESKTLHWSRNVNEYNYEKRQPRCNNIVTMS